MGAAPRHGCVLRVGRAADPADAARPAGAGRRARRPRCRRGGQLRVPRVRRPVGDADAPGPPDGRRRGGRAAAARRGLRRGQRPGARHRPRGWSRSSNSCRSTRRSASPSSSAGATPTTSSRSARSCGPRCATRPGWSPPSVPAPASRSPRSRRGWPNPTASGWSAATRNACCWPGCRSGGCGGSARSPRRSCTGSASTPSARLPR